MEKLVEIASQNGIAMISRFFDVNEKDVQQQCVALNSSGASCKALSLLEVLSFPLLGSSFTKTSRSRAGDGSVEGPRTMASVQLRLIPSKEIQMATTTKSVAGEAQKENDEENPEECKQEEKIPTPDASYATPYVLYCSSAIPHHPVITRNDSSLSMASPLEQRSLFGGTTTPPPATADSAGGATRPALPSTTSLRPRHSVQLRPYPTHTRETLLQRSLAQPSTRFRQDPPTSMPPPPSPSHTAVTTHAAVLKCDNLSLDTHDAVASFPPSSSSSTPAATGTWETMRSPLKVAPSLTTASLFPKETSTEWMASSSVPPPASPVLPSRIEKEEEHAEPKDHNVVGGTGVAMKEENNKEEEEKKEEEASTAVAFTDGASRLASRQPSLFDWMMTAASSASARPSSSGPSPAKRPREEEAAAKHPAASTTEREKAPRPGRALSSETTHTVHHQVSGETARQPANKKPKREGGSKPKKETAATSKKTPPLTNSLAKLAKASAKGKNKPPPLTRPTSSFLDDETVAPLPSASEGKEEEESEDDDDDDERRQGSSRKREADLYAEQWNTFSSSPFDGVDTTPNDTIILCDDTPPLVFTRVEEEKKRKHGRNIYDEVGGGRGTETAASEGAKFFGHPNPNGLKSFFHSSVLEFQNKYQKEIETEMKVVDGEYVCREVVVYRSKENKDEVLSQEAYHRRSCEIVAATASHTAATTSSSSHDSSQEDGAAHPEGRRVKNTTEGEELQDVTSRAFPHKAEKMVAKKGMERDLSFFFGIPSSR